MSFIANPYRLALEVVAEVSAPPPPVDFTAWAISNVSFAEGTSPFPGPYDPRRFPFFERILNVLSPEHPATHVVLIKSAQLGGTVLANIFIGALLDLVPGPVFYVHPTDGNARKWRSNKFEPLVKSSPRLTLVLKPDNARKGNNLFRWERRDGRGFLQLAGANSPSQLSMDSYPIAVHDDISKWLADNGKGDPEVQADSRTKAFLSMGGKIFKISTPDVEPGCRISRKWRQGTRERWTVPCPHCGGMQALEWDNMLACLDEANPDDAHFTCLHCHRRIEEHHRAAMNAAGHWVAENPGAEIVSFYLWTAYSPLESWASIAKAWISAKGNPGAERAFENDIIGRAYQTAMAAPDWTALRERAQTEARPRAVIPSGFAILTIGCDCQIDRVEWQAVAWGPKGQRGVIDWGIIPNHVSEQAAHDALGRLLDRDWPDSFGNQRRLDMLAIDGNAWRDDVFAWAKKEKWRKVMIVRGAKGDTAPPLARVKHERTRGGDVIKTSRRWFNVGVSGMKASLYANLRKTDPLEVGFIGFVRDLEEEYYRELTSEQRKPLRTRNGATEWRWVPLPGVDQEMLDTHLYAWAAAIKAGVMTFSDEQWQAMLARLEVPAPSAQPDLFSYSPPAGPSSAPPAASPAAAGSVVSDAATRRAAVVRRLA